MLRELLLKLLLIPFRIVLLTAGVSIVWYIALGAVGIRIIP